MNQYNPKIHHRRSIRLNGYDYSQNGLYFITICVQNRECLFGNVIHGEMKLNDYGQIAFDEWNKTPEIRPNVELDAFIEMPNHIHGIIRLSRRGVLNTPQQPDNINVGNTLRSPSQTVGAIIRGYKSSVIKKINGMAGVPKTAVSIWQRNYYEHIIRDEKSYHTISEYIINNPINWTSDNFYQLNTREEL